MSNIKFTMITLIVNPVCQVVDPYESYEWRTSLTTREKELSIREMNLISRT